MRRAILASIPASSPPPPLAIGWTARRLLELADRVARPRELPPRRLRARVGAPGRHEFAAGGRQAAGELLVALAAAGGRLDAVHSLLDFGCGAGRVLPHLAAHAPRARATGCDVDARAITWAARHRPELDWVLSGYAPALPFADGAFDLIYSISVFSHLDEKLQRGWLGELRRVLVPGGVALLSVHGADAFDAFRSGTARSSWCAPGAFARDPLHPDEFVFVAYRRSRWNAGDLPGIDGGYGLAFHGQEYVRQAWSDQFEVTLIQPRALTGWQDLVVLRG